MGIRIKIHCLDDIKSNIEQVVNIENWLIANIGSCDRQPHTETWSWATIDIDTGFLLLIVINSKFYNQALAFKLRFG